MADFLQIKNLKFSFSKVKDKALISIPELKVNQGEKVFLFGPSGCGKSTLLEILSGVLSADSGQILINGQDLHLLSPAQKDQFRAENISYIFQNFNLLPYLNIFENITLPLSFKKDKIDFKNVRVEVEELCRRLGILEHIDQSISQLSVGQQQRVAVARALISKPKVILADEPTSALDFDHRDQFLKLLFENCSEKNITLVFVSHDQTLKTLFDRTIAFKEINQAGQL